MEICTATVFFFSFSEKNQAQTKMFIFLLMLLATYVRGQDYCQFRKKTDWFTFRERKKTPSDTWSAKLVLCVYEFKCLVLDLVSLCFEKSPQKVEKKDSAQRNECNVPAPHGAMFAAKKL
jgi:hypothetical protein